MTVLRPHAYGGDVFADTGGLIVAVRSDGRVSYTRVVEPGKPWPVAVGKTPLPIDAWSTVTCEWDGATAKVFVNGQLDGETACPPGFDSYIRALGCNPFGLSSDYFHGDLARFEIVSLGSPRSAAPR